MDVIPTEINVKLQKHLLRACDLRVIFKIPLSMKNYFSFKDKTKQELRSLLLYNFNCNSCNTKCMRKTKEHYRMRTSEHICVSPLIGKYFKNKSETLAVHDRMLFCPKDFKILA